MIDWTAFDWQSFSTLATGFAAVAGATFIGVRQHALARAQASIAARQAATAETATQVARLKLRADLFERRMEVYQAIHAYLAAALSTKMGAIWDATPELDRQLVRAKFLFSQEITVELEAAIAESDELNNQKFDRNEARDAGDDVTALNADIRRLRKALRHRLARLAETLGEEMKLYAAD